MAQHRGRGRLSSIEQLPEDCDDIVAWAAEALRDRQFSQVDILDKFNQQLRDRAIELNIKLPTISASAFNRYSIKLALVTRRITEAREVASAVTARLEPGETDELTVMTAELVKTLAFELLSSGKGLTPKNAMELASAVKSAVAAQKASTQRRQEMEDRMASAVDETIEAVSKEAGLTKDQTTQIRRDVLGVRK